MVLVTATRLNLDEETFRRIAREYRGKQAVDLCAVDPEGRISLGHLPAAVTELPEGVAVRRQAVDEALRWGEPTVNLCPPAHLIWAVPLLVNAELRGGLIACVSEQAAFQTGSQGPGCNVRRASHALRLLAEEENLTNAALLAARREQHDREQSRAYALHEVKRSPSFNFHQMYFLEEPALIAAIRRGQRGEAREIVNRLLVGMIHRAGSRIELTKSFFLELVVSMCRTAVEAGGSPQELLGDNFGRMTELALIRRDEDLAAWLHRMLEEVMDSIHRHRHRSDDVLLADAMRYMAEHCGEPIGRDEVAGVACMSPAHFSRTVSRRFGRAFTELLNQARVDCAADVLVRTEKPLSVVALECGFQDQSYFTKVFRRYRGMTPRAYRKDAAQNASKR
jgi:AraC-like DNA-binding protein